jgi:PhnB protein
MSKPPHAVRRRNAAPDNHKQEIDMNATVRPIPDGFHTITPHLVCANAAQAIDFYKRAFGAVEDSCLTSPDGRVMNAQLRIGDSILMLCDEYPEHGGFGPLALKGTPVTIHLFVPDVDAAFARAVAAGGTATMPPAPMFWGDRYGQLQDPFGHRWSIATRERDLTQDQVREEAAAMMATMQECEGAQQ